MSTFAKYALNLVLPTIDGERRAGDIARVIGRKENHRAGKTSKPTLRAHLLQYSQQRLLPEHRITKYIHAPIVL